MSLVLCQKYFVPQESLLTALLDHSPDGGVSHRLSFFIFSCIIGLFFYLDDIIPANLLFFNNIYVRRTFLFNLF